MEKNQQYDDVQSGKSELYGMNENEGDGDESRAEWMDEYFNACPEGYKFVPTDEEILELLVKRDNNEPLPLEDIPLYNLYLADPIILFNIHNEEVAYYLTKPMRPEQEAGDGHGYWKPTGTEMPITSNDQLLGYRKALDFYRGKQPSGRKTRWKMHEYRLNKTGFPNPQEGVDAMKVDVYVICKVYQEEETEMDDEQHDVDQETTDRGEPSSPS